MYKRPRRSVGQTVPRVAQRRKKKKKKVSKRFANSLTDCANIAFKKKKIFVSLFFFNELISLVTVDSELQQ